MKRRGRGLRPEEQDLWKRITDTATPLNAEKTMPQLISERSEAKTPEPNHVKPFKVGERAKPPKTETRISVPDQPLHMDRKAFTRMKRGKSRPDARIDLHGMTVDMAHAALRAFLLRCHAEGKRLVLVITGKGRNDGSNFSMEPGRGILRRQVPHWLEQPPLRQIVLQTSEAHQKHGGAGAIYVYLRR
ncbi:MAG: Smr/MutS family protein [Pseudomonadota bacterium]